MRKLKKAIIGVLAAAMLMGAMTGCGKAASDDITVISREDGSGTRGAFIELFGIEEKDADGNKIDKTITTADITNSTSVMMTSVADDTAAIGYISLGSLDDSVKAVKIDGAEASVENVSNGSYKVSRPFNIATKGTPNEVTQDFINFILSLISLNPKSFMGNILNASDTSTGRNLPFLSSQSSLNFSTKFSISVLYLSQSAPSRIISTIISSRGRALILSLMFTLAIRTESNIS